MKPISEYNFREIVGKFVQFKSNNLEFEYDKYIGYCYIDPSAGISIRVLSAIVGSETKALHDISIILRYDPDMNIDIYITPDEYMVQQKSFIDNIYSNNLLEALRNRTELDPYRKSTQYPDDLLLQIATYIHRKIEFETLWVRLVQIDSDGNIFAKVIEDGMFFGIGTDVAIVNNKFLGGSNVFDLANIIAVDKYVVDYIIKKGRLNDIQETQK